jgi:DNA segregation ATPase FtsK/SpoIIIE-like protein
VLVSQEPYYITVDVPRREREIVYFADHTDALQSSAAGALNFLLGMAPSGEVFVEDIARLPHLLIAGATGSGKSVLLRSILCSLMLVRPPQELRVLLVDPKQIDFMPFEDAPHLVNGQIVSDPQQAVADLQENIEVELARRRPILRSAGVSNALEFYEAGGTRRELPQMVIVVDEFADLGSTLDRAGRAAFMGIIQRYGQLTRAYGIYLVLATQRPSVQVITGDIKANMTARIALKLLAPQDSVTILGHAGAESLRDKGDLIFEHAGRRERLQGFFVKPQDIIGAVNRWRSGSTA